MNSVFKNIKKQFESKLPFVAYRKPNETLVSAFLQETDTLFFTENFKEIGFVFAPFDSVKKTVLIPEKHSEFLSEEITIDEELIYNSQILDATSSKEMHINLVKKAIEEIKKSEIKKVVVSRKEIVKLANFEIITVFKKLLSLYSNAMVYVWFHPKVGLWFGASPETLLKIKDSQFETMALAGTQTFNGTTDVTWQQKEIEEQQFVTDYIIENLQSSAKKITVSKTETIKAGNLLHLRTKISGQLETDSLKLISKLHPTPAVCGLPLDLAKEFISKNENYNRSFYTGFLGEINISEKRNKRDEVKSNLYVNLRCMEVLENYAHIYVGGGITKDSHLTKEWEETVAKTRVMKKVL